MKLEWKGGLPEEEGWYVVWPQGGDRPHARAFGGGEVACMWPWSRGSWVGPIEAPLPAIKKCPFCEG